MELEWKLFADLKEHAGDGRVTVDVDEGATVGDALAALVEARSGLDGRVLDDDGELHDHVNVLKNGSSVHTDAGLETVVEAGDELALFPPVSGGAEHSSGESL
jgi:molybdopterin synthase sulfur carrier subunit